MLSHCRRAGPFAMWFAAMCAYAATPAVDDAMWTYQVARGDTLIAITHELVQPGIGWRRVQRLNPRPRA